MSVQALQQRSNTRNPNSSKFIIDCSSKITQGASTTESWLKITEKLKPTNFIDDTRVLLGVLEERGNKVVIKIGSSQRLKKEYDIGQVLSKLNGFVHYICFFTCNDDHKRHDGSVDTLCKGPGESMGCLVMPYYSKGALADSKDTILIKTCIKHVCMCLGNAFETHGFVHNDLHARNVLMTHGNALIPVAIVDFENAFVVGMDARKNRYFVYKDMARLVADMAYNSALEYNNVGALLTAIEKHGTLNSDFNVAFNNIFALVDALDITEKTPVGQFVYRANVF